MAGPNDLAILDLLSLKGTPEATPDLESTLAMLIRNNGGSIPEAPTAALAPTAPSIQLDPNLKADENGHNLTRTGEANTTGAAERITAAAPKWYPGVTVTRQANGTLSLSNNAAVPAEAGGSASERIAGRPNVSNDLFASIQSLRNTNDPDSARGILADIRQTAAVKSTELQREAMDFASKKLGVPMLEQQLREAEAADRADGDWYPGIGDSSITAKIRAALLTTRGSVDNEAKNYLVGNTTYASMQGALKTAEEEAKRIDVLGTRKDQKQDTADMRAADRLAEDMREARAIVNTLNPEEQKRLHTLNGSIAAAATPEDQMLAMAATVKRADKDRNMQVALGAPEEELPALALAGNADARVLALAREKELNPTQSDEYINSKFNAVKAMAENDKLLTSNAVKIMFPGREQSDEAKAYAASLKMSSIGNSVQERMAAKEQKYRIAMEIYRKNATARFAGDTRGWNIQDPEFLVAQDRAVKTTGNSSMEAVLTAYLDTKEPKEKLARLNSFVGLTESVASRQTKSLFGAPDSIALKAAIIRSANPQGIWAAMQEILMMPTDQGVGMAPFGTLGAIAVGTNAAMLQRQ